MFNFDKSPPAFPCMTSLGCPKRTLELGQKGFCPAWYDAAQIEETNVITNETRVMRGCMFQLVPRMCEYVVTASNRPAEEISRLRNEVGQAVVRGVANFLTQADPDLIIEAMARTKQLRGNGTTDTKSFKLNRPET
jgi:hypothetical protein